MNPFKFLFVFFLFITCSLYAQDEFFPQQIYIMEVHENLFYNSKTKKITTEPVAISLTIPSEMSPAGIEKTLATYSYKELKNLVFKGNPDALWVNPLNPLERKNTSYALENHFFEGRMFAYLNPITAQTIYDCNEPEDLLCSDNLVEQDLNDTSTIVGKAVYKYMQKFDAIFPNIDLSKIKYYHSYPKGKIQKKKKKKKHAKFLCQISYRVFMNSRQNIALFRHHQELSKLIIEATKNGIIRPFNSNQLKQRMPYEKFMENMLIPTEDAGLSEEELALGFGEEEDSWGSDGDWGDSGGNLNSNVQTYNWTQVQEKTPEFNTESYAFIGESTFSNTINSPLSTFSIDVDRASYSNVRRIINTGKTPPIDAVRIEEMINYFDYDYPQPEKKVPFSVSTELSSCPWNDEAQLIHIGIQGKTIPKKNLPASNIVFLLDVSGSMGHTNKLPLLKKSLKLLVNELRPKDRVAIVVYAGAAGLVLPSTSGEEKLKIIDSFENLSAGGSTAGGEGIILAYKIAKENFKKNGNNRIIIATDGDFNIGASSDAEMIRLIESKRDEGVFLTCLGFGMGNYKDSKMEQIADKGNGNYAYIDGLDEAKKVLVKEFGGTLFTIAKDVKLQIEFNPASVKSYRLIGYQNRKMANKDFSDDKKDAGDLGSGHSVTALYEVILGNAKLKSSRSLKYQEQILKKNINKEELLTLKLRYKKPNEDKSHLIETTILNQKVNFNNASANLRFAASVTQFGMLLRNSAFKGSSSYENVIKTAQKAKGEDKNSYRIDFIELVKKHSQSKE